MFQLYGKPERFTHLLDLRSHSLTPFIPELAPWIDRQLKALPASASAARPSAGPPIDPDFSMLHYLQRRIARAAENYPAQFPARPAWDAYRSRILQWLRAACGLDSLHPGESRRIAQTLAHEVVVEELELSLDGDFTCPALLYHRPDGPPGSRPAVILSHDSDHWMKSPGLGRAASELVELGYWVLTPEHASLNAASRRRVQSNGLVSFYGAADTVGLPPLALRVADNLAAFKYLLARSECDPRRIVLAGLGLGGVDACLAAALEERAAGVVSVGAITARAWAEEVAAAQPAFTRIMPYLPGLLKVTDFEYYFAALAPRPLIVVRWGKPSRWPIAGYDRIDAMAGQVFRLTGSAPALAVIKPEELTASSLAQTQDELRRQMRAAARAPLPAPPRTGEW